MRDAFVSQLATLAADRPEIFLITGDLGYGVLEEFATKFSKQFLNAGVAEQNMMGMAAGLADSGRLPFVYSIANFPTFRCLEQIRNDVCYPALPVTIVAVGAGFSYGSLGYSHHALEDIAIMRALPGMRILSPCDSSEVAAALNLIVEDPMPTYLRLGKSDELVINHSAKQTLKSSYVLKSGRGVCILTTGAIAGDVLTVVQKSNDRVLSAAHVVSVPILKPMDLTGLDFQNFDFLITVEEHSLVGGLNSAVYEYFRDSGFSMRISALGIRDEIRHDSGSSLHLRDLAGLSLRGIEDQITRILKD